MLQEDLELEQKVWNRVNGGCPCDRLRTLMLRAEGAAADYRRMAALASGRTRERLVQLRHQEQSTAAILRGLLILSGGEPGRPAGGMQIGGSLRQLLAAACRQCARTREDYEALAEDPDWTGVFRQLESRAAQTQLTLLEILGGGER